MADSEQVTEDDVSVLAKVAGCNLSPEDRGAIAGNLSALRASIAAKAKTLPDDLAPVLTFDPRWQARK